MILSNISFDSIKKTLNPSTFNNAKHNIHKEYDGKKNEPAKWKDKIH